MCCEIILSVFMGVDGCWFLYFLIGVGREFKCEVFWSLYVYVLLNIEIGIYKVYYVDLEELFI